MYMQITLEVPYAAANLTAPEKPATLTPVYLPFSQENGWKIRPAVVICPGGGYDYCSEREAIPVAMRFASYGVQAFVLDYSVVKKPFPMALMELAAAVAYVRSHAKDYEVDPNRILVCGFSAGGHLAGSLGVHWNHAVLTDVMGDSAAYRPNGQILCYPVITAGENAHRGSIDNLTDGGQCRMDMVSLETQVDGDTPQTFLWHTSDDDCVPVENTLMMAQALATHHIPFELHIYPHGGHGLSLSDETTAMGDWHCNSVCASWFTDCIAWIRREFPAAN